MIIKKNYLLLLLFIISELVSAQTDFRKAYIINKEGDTLHGEIDYRGDLKMGTLCKFKSTDNIITEYSPNKILSYRFYDSKFFVSKNINGKSVFLEYLIKGKVNIYYMRDEVGNHYFLDNDNGKLTEIPYYEEYRTINGIEYIYKSTKHIELLSHHMKDASDIQSQINNVKKPNHFNLIKLAKNYHNAVCEDEKCIIFEKQEPLFKVNIESIGGIIKLKKRDELFNKSLFQTGVFAHIWMPRVNEKVYLKTGLLNYYTENNDGTIDKRIIIQTHIGYIAPNTHRLRPTFSVALLSPTYSGGLMVKINKSLNIGIQSWVDFYPTKMPWIPNKFHSYSILTNLYIEL